VATTPQQVSRFLGGNTRAVGSVRTAIERVVAGFHFPEGWSSDLVQEALGRVYLAVLLGRYRGVASLKTFARRVARYTCLEHLRWQRRKTSLDPDRWTSTARWSRPEDELLRRERHCENIRAFAALPGEGRELLVLLFVEGLSYREIAERTGLTESAIRSRVHRCRLSARARSKPVSPKAAARPRPGLGIAESR